MKASVPGSVQLYGLLVPRFALITGVIRTKLREINRSAVRVEHGVGDISLPPLAWQAGALF